MNSTRHPKLFLSIAWLLTSTTISLISIYGRPLQKWAFSQFGVSQVAVILGITLSLSFIAFLFHMIKTGGKKQLWHLLWLAALFVTIQLKIPIVEERMHVILFGLFGFISLRLFPLSLAIIACIMMSAGDEALQYYLVDRVGDWNDVYLNLLSSGLGAILSICSQRKENSNSGRTAENTTGDIRD
jgi:hypothetical protein